MKKKIFLLSILVLLTFIKTEAQIYKIGVITVMGTNQICEGEIIVTDSSVVISPKFNGTSKLSNYKLIKNINGTIYFTDEVMTNYFIEYSQQGTKKGFEYNTMLTLFFDKRLGGESLIYWCKKETK